MNRLTTVALALLSAALVLAGSGCGPQAPRGEDVAPAGERADGRAPEEGFSRPLLDRSLELGRRFLLNAQRPVGNFVYQVNFLTGRIPLGDNAVRQAGTLWGLALIHQDSPSAETAEAIERGLAFFDGCSRETPDGRKYVAYPGDDSGATGTVALVALALIDYLRSGEHVRQPARYREDLAKYLRFLRSLRMENGHFHGGYALADGAPRGRPSPYFDGEALLAMAKAASHLGYESFRDLVIESAEAQYRDHVALALAEDPDSEVTKGYFQWGILTWFELVEAGWPGAEKWAGAAVDLAHWMVDVHRTLERTRNTAYAYEGIASAWELARRAGDTASTEKFRRVIEDGLGTLTSWQVGGPAPNAFLLENLPQDARWVGGVMNAADDPVLRIDVTQHQMHALILVRRFLFARAR